MNSHEVFAKHLAPSKKAKFNNCLTKQEEITNLVPKHSDIEDFHHDSKSILRDDKRHIKTGDKSHGKGANNFKYASLEMKSWGDGKKAYLDIEYTGLDEDELAEYLEYKTKYLDSIDTYDIALKEIEDRQNELEKRESSVSSLVDRLKLVKDTNKKLKKKFKKELAIIKAALSVIDSEKDNLSTPEDAKKDMDDYYNSKINKVNEIRLCATNNGRETNH